MIALTFPLEFVVEGTPASQQASARTRSAWKETVQSAARRALPEQHAAFDRPVAVTLFYFPDAPMQGDLDNIVKPTLDALNSYIYLDDSQIDRVLAQRFSKDDLYPGRVTETLETALSIDGPATYIRVSDDPFEDFAREP